MLIDITPLKKYRDYRLLIIGQAVSMFGTMITMVALPFQIYECTHSTLLVGLLSLFQLVPLLFTALLGGVLADRLNRRKLLIGAEIFLILGCLALSLNSLQAHPSVVLIFIAGISMSAINGLHRPALDGLTPRLVDKDDLPAVSAINSLKMSFAMVIGPMVGGLLIANLGFAAAYLADMLTFLISLIALTMIRTVLEVLKTSASPLSLIKEGFTYAISRQELIGSYVVDIVAMIFGMPNALFPAMSENFGGASVVGMFYAAPAVGAVIASLFSNWTKKIKRHGMGIIYAAAFWGLAILGFGLAKKLWLSLFFLGLAGAFDAISGIFRMTLWNQTIPDRLRGRLASIEMISYISGPMLGNAEAGFVAAIFGVTASVVSGGVCCIVAVVISAWLLPKFRDYRAE